MVVRLALVRSRFNSRSLIGLTVTTDEDTIQINTAKFWHGNRKGSSRITNPETLYIHMSPDCTPQEVFTITLITTTATCIHVHTQTTRHSPPRIRQSSPRNPHIHPHQPERHSSPGTTHCDTHWYPHTTEHRRGGGQRNALAITANTRSTSWESPASNTRTRSGSNATKRPRQTTYETTQCNVTDKTHQADGQLSSTSMTLNIARPSNRNTTGMRRSDDSKIGTNGAPPPQTRYNASKTSCSNARETAYKQNRRRSRKQRQN